MTELELLNANVTRWKLEKGWHRVAQKGDEAISHVSIEVVGRQSRTVPIHRKQDERLESFEERILSVLMLLNEAYTQGRGRQAAAINAAINPGIM